MQKTRRPLWIILAAILALRAERVAADLPASPSEIDSVKSDLARVKTELEDVKRQLGEILHAMQQRSAQGTSTAPPGDPVRTSVTDAPVLGQSDAPVTLVEFSDYQCPYCRTFFLATLPSLKREYIDTGKLRYVFRDYPLDQIHPQARRAAEAARCAGDQGKYWEMHDVLFQNQRALAPSEFSEHARNLGLDAAAFDACLESAKYAARVNKDHADGTAAGVQGTPGFVLAKTQAGDSVEGTQIRGAQPLDVFRKLIDQLLAEH
jgi:protein-disulfide isomerase